MKKRVLAMVLCVVMCLGMMSMFTGCKKDGGSSAAKPDAFVIMSENLDGLFNPYYSTSAPDGTIVSMTQIGMLGSNFVDGKVQVAYGDNEAVVVKDYDIIENDNDTTTYTFVLKNGIKYSDGHPLTMEDVLFNFYVYLDPVYTGSSTLYSTAIVGLEEYRTQQVTSGSTDGNELINKDAAARAENRLNELIDLFLQNKENTSTGEFPYAMMVNAIKNHTVSSGYKNAVAIPSKQGEVTYQNLLADYEYALKLFREELEADYVNCQDSYTEEPYKSHPEFQDEIFRFMFTEGYFVDVVYPRGDDGKYDYTKIESMTKKYDPSIINTKEKAIEYVFNSFVTSKFDMVLSAFATAGKLVSEYTAKAKEVILRTNAGDGDLTIPNISGIVSLGHSELAGSEITVNGNTYKVAKEHNDDGTVVNAEEYDVLRITIEGIDPKAIWNFAIPIAPQHYYGEGSKVGMDIANNKFGVEFASFSFMSDIIQSPRNVSVPMGAGAYQATNANNDSNPSGTAFFSDNIVYFKANPYFETVGSGINNAKIEKVRYQVVSSNNAIGALESGSVHYISPALTNQNFDKLESMKSNGYVSLRSRQLGYGYIGINASKVKDQNLRKALMCAMNTSLALQYYRADSVERIFWPMSMVSWAYPSENANDNGKDYPQMGKWDVDIAKENIQKYMEAAGDYSEKDLKITFTIAGSTLQDHPTYLVFRDAADLLNSMGWNITVVCDPQALIKISTGSLAVWAAAWSSALDPDLYQVYHQDSTATSTLAWGYNWLKSEGSTAEEKETLALLSDLIDQARETNDQEKRKELYEKAMGYILDLAIELPVYQRDVLYAYNSNVISSASMPSEVNPYSSPLDRIWEIEFAS